VFRYRMNQKLELTGQDLRLETVERVAGPEAVQVRLARSARRRVQAARGVVDAAVVERQVVYGVTTGFGALSDITVPAERLGELQENLVRSHAAGTGEPLDEAAVRATMLLRANVLARGHSGIRPGVIDLLLKLLNRRVHPVIPRYGSVGASGDLAPLSHLALLLIGEGTADVGGERVPGAEALRRAGLEPVRLAAKEGLALNNGTQVQTALGVLSLLAAERSIETAEVAAAMSLEGLRGTPDPYASELHALRPHPGAVESAARLRVLLHASEIRESHREDDPRVQDAYSLRCVPAIHGAARQAAAYVRSVLEVEVNSVTDNPVVLAEERRIVSGGNFHGQPVAQALDLLAIACANIANVSERRVARLVDTARSGLPAFLTPEPGVNSGMMMVQVTAAALVAELRLRANPASVHTVPTSADREDHVPMGMAAALKAREAVRLLETVLAIELLVAAQALELLRPLRPGRGVEAAYGRIRSRVPPLTRDRVLAPDVAAVEDLVRAGEFDRIARQAR